MMIIFNGPFLTGNFKTKNKPNGLYSDFLGILKMIPHFNLLMRQMLTYETINLFSLFEPKVVFLK